MLASTHDISRFYIRSVGLWGGGLGPRLLAFHAGSFGLWA